MDRRKDEFLAMLGHELRNPLAPVLHALDVLRRARPEHLEDEDWALAVMDRQLAHLRRIVDDLLDMGRISRGIVELQRETLDLRDIIAPALETVRPLVDRLRHELSIDLPTEPLWIDADATRLVQVVINLLHNAAKYTPPGGRLAVSIHREDDKAILRVRDNGHGISPDLLGHVFDLFTQGEVGIDRAERGLGLGLGLTLVRRLVEMHGGRVTAASEGAGLGSVFELRLPLASSPADRAATRPVETTPAAAPARRVLVVDDNRDAAEALGLLLTHRGHAVETAHDGPAALDVAETFGPDVVLLDIGLPGLDGYEVYRRLRAGGGDRLLIIAITGYGQDSDAERSRRAGFDHHLVKPVDIRQLEELVASPAPTGAG